MIVPSGEAVRLLSRTQCQAARVLAETHPLQGELADAMARAYATVGEEMNVYVRYSIMGLVHPHLHTNFISLKIKNLISKNSH